MVSNLRRVARLGCVAMAASLLPAVASAQFIDFTPQADMAARILMDQAIHRSVSRSRELVFGAQDLKADAPAKARDPARPILIQRAAPGSGIARLAQAYPEARRPQAEAVFRQIWAKYPQALAKIDPKLSAADLSGSVTLFVLGCFMAYEDRDVSDAHFTSLLQQTRSAMAPRMQARPADAKELYALHEQLGVIGLSMVLMREELVAKPNPEMARSNKEVAGRYLSTFLGVDVKRVRFSERGLQALD